MKYRHARYNQTGRGRADISSRFRNTVKASIVILVVMVAMLVFGLTPKKLVNGVGVSLWHFRAYTGEKVDGFTTVIRSKAEIVEENARLKSIVNGQEIEKIQLRLLGDENRELRSLLYATIPRDSASSTEFKTMAVQVITRPPQSLYDIIMVNAGSDWGVNADDWVYGSDGVVLGKVVEVATNISKIEMLSTPGQKWGVYLEPGHISAVAEGAGNGNFQIEIPRSDETFDDSVVTLIGTDSLLGIVRGGPERKTSESMQKLFVQSPINIQQLKWVLIHSGE